VVNDVKQTEKHAAKPVISMLSPAETKVANVKFKRYKLPAIAHVQTVVMQAGNETLYSEIHVLIRTASVVLWSEFLAIDPEARV
jgi:hypothetical protein